MPATRTTRRSGRPPRPAGAAPPTAAAPSRGRRRGRAAAHSGATVGAPAGGEVQKGRKGGRPGGRHELWGGEGFLARVDARRPASVGRRRRVCPAWSKGSDRSTAGAIAGAGAIDERLPAVGRLSTVHSRPSGGSDNSAADLTGVTASAPPSAAAVDFRPGRCRRESTLLARGLRRLFPCAWLANASELEALRDRPTCVTDPASVAGGRRRARVPPRPEPRVCLGRRHGRHRVSTPDTDPPSPCRAHEMTQRRPDPIQRIVPAATGSLGRVSSASPVHHSCVQESMSAQEEVRDRGSEVLFEMLLRHHDGARRSLPAQEDIA